MTGVPRWVWATYCGVHRLVRGHWPDYVLLDAQLECLACDRKPPSRGMQVRVFGGV